MSQISKTRVIATNPLLVGNRVELHDASLPRGGHEIINVREVGEEFLIPAQLLHVAIEKGFTLRSTPGGPAAVGGQYTPPTQVQLAAAQQEQPRAYSGTLGENKSGETLVDDSVSAGALTNRTRRNVSTDRDYGTANPDVKPIVGTSNDSENGAPGLGGTNPNPVAGNTLTPQSPNVKTDKPILGTNNA